MGPTSEINTWLEQLGLGRYSDLFAEHEIDLSVLPDLTNEDWVELGLPLGPRRKIQKAIAGLRQPIPGELPEQVPGQHSEEAAERRHLTVMFADIVGSSVMSTKMDPEELRELMRAFQDASKSAVDRFHGFIARFMGDGVLAYFGYPQAHEDDPERSVRAGLELIRQIAVLNEKLCAGKGVDLQVRVGIATGPVVVGDLIGEGASSERSVVGETPNIAAKIEAGAPPGNVVVGTETLKLLGNRFETEELPPRTLSGFDEPIRLFLIVSERPAVSRFQATRTGIQAGFVGRSEELATLRSCWNSACNSRGAAIQIIGEAGVGKSRITEEFLRQAAVVKPLIYQFQCSPFHSNSAFHPIIERLVAISGIKKTDTAETIRGRLDDMLHHAPRSKSESIQLMAAFLSVDIGEALPSRLIDNPPLRLAAMHEMLVEQLLASTEESPVIVVFEDAHWMDPTTLETTLQLARASRNQRLLVLVTSRPDVGTEHFLRREMRTINLRGLNRAETEELVRNMPQGRALERDALNAVVERTDGIPLFIEELTKLVLERSDECTGDVSSIPTTLVDSLTARLDRLGAAKGVAQIGATIGREFSLDLLCRIDNREKSLVLEDIDRLIEAELVQPAEPGKSVVYRFKHALVQDAAYGTLLYSRRREHHSKIADTLIEIFPETAVDQPEILAYHLDEGGRALESVDYWQAAGLSATNRSANTEAVHHFTKGIEALRSANQTSPGLLHKELEIQIALGPPLMAACGYASSELEEAYSRAMAIGEQMEEGITDFRALWGLSSFYLLRGKLAQSEELQRQSVALAKQEDNQDWLAVASSWLGTVQFYRNELADADQWLRRCLQIYGSRTASRLGYQYGLDPAILARVHLVWLHWLRGETDKAHELDEETLAFSDTLDHPLSHVHALNFSVVLQAFQGNYAEAKARADKVLAVSGEYEFPHYLAYARIMRGYATAKLGSMHEGIDDMVTGLKARRETGAELVRPMFLTMLAEVLSESGQHSWSIETLNEADSIVSQNGEDWLQAESYRMRGIVLDHLSPGQEKGIEWVRKAVDIARQSGAKSLEIRAIHSLVDMLTRADKAEYPLEDYLGQLAQLVSELTQDSPSRDLQRSRELLTANGFG